MRKVYMDYGAATPLDPRVLEAMTPFLTEQPGNPSSLHSRGHVAKRALEESRATVSSLFGIEDPKQLVFTSGPTESNNLAILGTVHRNKDKGNHIITSAIEHMSVLNPCKDLLKQGFEVSFIPVDKEGFVDVERIKNEIRKETVLVSVMYANGEIGTIEPIQEIGKITSQKEVYFHVDATAACGKIPIDVEKDLIDLLTISSNDMYGPQGVGALYIRKGVRTQPIMLGGGQERGLRSGTENIAAIVGLAKAAEIASAEMGPEGNRLSALRDQLLDGILNNIDEVYLTGSRTNRLPNNASFRFSYIEGESIILNLDMMGVSAASGSACTSKTLEPSHVLIALGLRHEEAHGSLLFTLGRANADEDVDYVLEILPAIISKLRAMSPLAPRKE
jgi:cysteine desulfurase